MNHKSKIALLVGLLLFTTIASSAPMRFRYITNRDGLKYTWVLDIMEDSYGYMWFSTQYGAYRYDGYNFEDYTFNIPDNHKSARVNCVFEDQSGLLWFATNNGLYSHDRRFNTYTHYTNTANSPLLLSSLYIADIEQDANGNIWIATDNGVDCILVNGEIKTYNIPNNNNISQILHDSNQTIWLGTTSGTLWKYDHNKDCFEKLSFPSCSIQTIWKLFEDSKHNIWIGTYDDGLYCYNQKSDSFSHYTVQNHYLPSNMVRAIAQDSDGSILVGGEHGIVSISANKSKRISSSSNPYSINDNAVYCMHTDKKGNLWVGTFFGGVNLGYKHTGSFELMLSSSEYYQADSKVVSAIVGYQDGFLIGTENHGIYLLDSEGNETRNITGFKSDNIHSICEDTYGNLWFGSYQGGLFMKPIGANQYKRFRPNSDNVYCIFNDSKGNLWVGTQFGGLSRYNYKTVKFENFPKELPSSTFVWDIIEDRLGNIWVACYGDGVYKMSPNQDYKPQRVTLDEAFNFITLCELNDGRILAGTEMEGLAIINPISLSSTMFYPKEYGLTDNTIYGILQDQKHNIWFSTNSGLCKTNPMFTALSVYTVDDGLPSNRFNYNACSVLGDKLYFGSINGVAVVNPNNVDVLDSAGKLRFGNLYINNTREYIKAEGPLSEDLNTISKLVLKHDQNTLSFDFTNNCYDLDNGQNFAYKMAGLSNDWNIIEKGNRVDFLSLPHGRYTLSICNVQGVKLQTDNPIELEIVIKPIWWQSIVAKLAFVLLIIGIIVYVTYLLFLSSKHKHELAIEKLEREKDKEINELKFNFFVNISHEFKTPLSLILGPVEQFINNKVDDNQRSRYLSIIKTNAEKLLHLINELLAFREIKLAKLKAEAIDIRPFVEKIMNRHSWLFEDKHIRVRLEIQDFTIQADKGKLEKIFDNVISNAYKYTPKDGFVAITIKQNAGNAQISIYNTGLGIAQDKLPYIFEHFFTSQSYDKYSSGVGLSYVKSLVELHSGSIVAKSQEGEYTEILISLPLKQKQLSNATKNEAKEFSTDIFSEQSLNFENSETDFEAEPYNSLARSTSILIVEDDSNMRYLLVDHFSKNYNVASTNNGEMAAQMARENKIDIIISDVMLSGGMSGFELCHYIKSDMDTSHIRVILMTVLSEEDYKAQGYKAGADSYIVKPFSFSLLEQRVRNIIISTYKARQMYKLDIDLSSVDTLSANSDEQLLKRTVDVIMEHISDAEFGVDELCHQLSMTKPTLYRKLKALTGQSGNEFIQNIRLKHASRLLKETSNSISEIGYQVGFSDPYYFSRSFKKQYGLSPKQYRELNS